MLITGDIDNLEITETRYFNYYALEDDLGPFEKYKPYHGKECEEVLKIEVIDGVEVEEYGWEIIGTNKIVEYKWTTDKQL